MYIGIDPGLSGGIAWWFQGEMKAVKMPETERDTYCMLDTIFADHVNDSAQDEPLSALIEKVSSSPQQGVTSAFTFGRGYGFLRGCLISLGIPFEEVRPQRWQKAMECLSGGDKNLTKSKAQQLFPALKITHSTADAILICEYNRRLNERK